MCCVAAPVATLGEMPMARPLFRWGACRIVCSSCGHPGRLADCDNRCFDVALLESVSAPVARVSQQSAVPMATILHSMMHMMMMMFQPLSPTWVQRRWQQRGFDNQSLVSQPSQVPEHRCLDVLGPLMVATQSLEIPLVCVCVPLRACASINSLRGLRKCFLTAVLIFCSLSPLLLGSRFPL